MSYAGNPILVTIYTFLFFIGLRKEGTLWIMRGLPSSFVHIVPGIGRMEKNKVSVRYNLITSVRELSYSNPVYTCHPPTICKYIPFNINIVMVGSILEPILSSGNS